MGKGITKRWATRYFSVSVMFLILVVFGAAFAVHNYYYDGVKRHLQELGQSAVKSCANSTDSEAWLEKYLRELERHESVFVVAADESGNVSDHTQNIDEELLKNVVYPVESPDSGDVRTVSLSTGEKLMSYCAVIYPNKDKHMTVLCFYESLNEADRKVSVAIIMLAACVTVIIVLFVAPFLMFLNTIVKPVRELRVTAHRIAQGDYEARAEKRFDDEIGELADSINYMAQQIKNSDTMKNDFISSVSHELRTPLTAIQGWAETMMVGGLDDEMTKKGLSIIVNESERLTGMVEELLDFSRIQSGRMMLTMAKTNLCTELSDAVYILRERASKDNKHIVYNEKKDLPKVLADKNRLRQVFINIIDNALKYSPTAGVVGIDVEQKDDFIVVRVSDSGCGISEKDLPHIKERFYKANKTVRGNGIGLAVADEIVTLHKGRLDIESKEDIGTTVTISIPVLDDDDEELLRN
ncbi:MAG: HAMP domain-containing histidine kinase [Clostridia bacterium]|nr:HAMP domain-containing histidine kinase [Clostridia bacterium]